MASNAPDTAPATNNLIEAATTLVTTMTRTGVAIVSAPLNMLPPQTRTDAVNAASGLINTVGSLHLGILKAVVSGVNVTSQEVDKALKDVNIPGIAKK
jgi:hypothetical protein